MTKKEKARDLITGALERLATDLERGQSDAFREYLAVMARFPDYSFRNAMLIASQRPESTYVAGYRAWQKLGRNVMKGERGIVIVAPLPPRAAEQKDSDDGQREDMRFRAVSVFDVS